MMVSYNNIPTTVLENEYLILQDIYLKGDDVQKLSVIQALPQLLQYDPNATLSRIVPKIQQELPKSSSEFHIATSKIFRLLIEKQLPLNLMKAVLQGTESRDPIVANAWIETLVAVIPIVTIDQVKNNVLPLALLRSQPTNSVYSRVNSCKIFGKAATHPNMTHIDVKTVILPAVQSLCQDCVPQVRTVICSELHNIAAGLGENLVRSELLPSLVELASDNVMAVRAEAVTAAVLIIPFINKETRAETIVPLVKQLCQKASEVGDTTYPTISKEFGKLVDALKNDLSAADSIWFLQFYKTLSSKGQHLVVARDNLEATQAVNCREKCAYNLPAVTIFTVSRIPAQLEFWHEIFSKLVNDPCYLVRRTTAGTIYEIANILGAECKIIKEDIIRLLRDDAEDVLNNLVPNISKTLLLFCFHGVISRETTNQTTLEIARAILKCHVELSKGHNWRIKDNLLKQMECLPKCMPSDFIHQHFSPVIMNCVLQIRPKPIRSQATRTLAIFLRYNLKIIQRKWIRDNLISNLCYSKSCYTRQIFLYLCQHIMDLFSGSYFKKHFFEPFMSLGADPISNIRWGVVKIFPSVYALLSSPEDKKMQTAMDGLLHKLEMEEKDVDIRALIKEKLKEMRLNASAKKQEILVEDKRRAEEENLIETGKCPHVALNVNVKDADRASIAGDSIKQRAASAPPRMGKSPVIASSDMSFLEQHFYRDAGVSIPFENREVDLIDTGLRDVSLSDPVIIEDVSEGDIQRLEGVTNITDDAKVNLRKIAKKMTNTGGNEALRAKRHSSVFPTTSVSSPKTNRRSLHLGAGDCSRIPVCLKKSRSIADVKVEAQSLVKEIKSRPKSEIAVDETSIKNQKPSIRVNQTKSALPVLKR